jgi:site-specific recombinase XerD
MAKMAPPKVPDNPPAVLQPGQLRALLMTCEARDFVSRRDAAILWLFIDTGGWRSLRALDLQRSKGP